MCASFMVVAILFLAPCSCESFVDEPALQQEDSKAVYHEPEETEMEGEEDGLEDDGEDYGTFPDELDPLRLAEPFNRDKERRDWVYSEDFDDDGFDEDNNAEFPKDSEWELSDVAEEEPNGEDLAEKKFNGDLGRETDDWDVTENSETVRGNVEKDLKLADEEGERKGKHVNILS